MQNFWFVNTECLKVYMYLRTAHLVWQSYHSRWFDMEHTSRRNLLLSPFF